MTDVITATNPALSSHIPDGLNFLSQNFDSKRTCNDLAVFWPTMDLAEI